MDKEIWSLIWKIANFTILVVLLYKLLANRVKTFFENRRMSIENAIKEAEKIKNEAEKKYEELKEKLQNIDKEAEKITELFRKEGLAEKERIIENAKKEAEKIKKQAVQTIEQEAIKARLMIRKEFAELMVKMAADLISKKQNDNDNERIVKEYIENIEKVVELN
ncbi:MAG: ATP synthase F0 subunit B [Thermodesulfobacteriota bacterium]